MTKPGTAPEPTYGVRSGSVVSKASTCVVTSVGAGAATSAAGWAVPHRLVAT